ncbi:MAG: hypothetical protein R2861_05825 [Desulfobacterales bacterium]
MKKNDPYSIVTELLRKLCERKTHHSFLKGSLFREAAMTAQNMGMTQRLAEFIVDTDEHKIDADAYDHAKVALMDWWRLPWGVRMSR